MRGWISRRHPNPKGTPPPPPPVTRRWAPGWYTALSIGQLNAHKVGGIGGIPNPGVRSAVGPVATGVSGLVVRQYWSDFEPNGAGDPIATRFRFALFDQLIAQAAAFPGPPVLIWFMLVNKTFEGGATPTIPLPADLIAVADGGTGTKTYATFFDGGPNVPNGEQVWRWDLGVVQPRQAEAWGAIANRYDGNPNFGGIATQETSTSGVNTNTAIDGFYTAAKYESGLIAEINAINLACKQGRQIFFSNFVSGGGIAALRRIAAVAQTYGVLWAGPDWVTNGGIVTNAYPVYKEYQDGTLASPATGNGPTGCSIQNPEWTGNPPGDNPVNIPNLYNYGTSTWTYGNPADPTMDHRTDSPLGLSVGIPDWKESGTDNFHDTMAPIMAAHPILPNSWTPP